MKIKKIYIYLTLILIFLASTGCTKLKEDTSSIIYENSKNIEDYRVLEIEEVFDNVDTEVVREESVVESKSNCAEIKFENYINNEYLIENKLDEIDYSSNPDAESFKNEIEAYVKEGVNYAGFYTIVEWGCGAICQDHAIIDLRDGSIVHFGLPSQYGIKYSSSSKLIIVNPEENIKLDLDFPEKDTKTSYYVLTGGSDNVFLKLECENIIESNKKENSDLGDYRDKCAINSDCIPEPSCHPKNCINKDFRNEYQKANVCTELFSCQAAYAKEDCVCLEGLCVNSNKDKDCTSKDDEIL